MNRVDRGVHGAPSAGAKGADALTRELRSLIVSGVYPPGHRLIQDELADRFGVSRIPLREAMRTLSSEGLLTTKPGSGTFVTLLDLDEIDEIYNLRRLIEPSFAEHVTERISRRDIGRFEAMVGEMDRVGEVGADSWSRTNLAFHLDMYRLSRLPLRYEIIAQMYHRLEPYSRFYVHGTSAYERVQHEHAAMVRALAEGDAEELARQIVAHIDGGQQGLHGAWEKSSAALHAYWAESAR